MGQYMEKYRHASEIEDNNDLEGFRQEVLKKRNRIYLWAVLIYFFVFWFLLTCMNLIGFETASIGPICFLISIAATGVIVSILIKRDKEKYGV